jgi:hypothetical protein
MATRIGVLPWRRGDRDDCEYFGPMRESFLSFRDGWCAAVARLTEEYRKVTEDRILFGSGFAMHTTGDVERIAPERIVIKPETSS